MTHGEVHMPPPEVSTLEEPQTVQDCLAASNTQIPPLTEPVAAIDEIASSTPQCDDDHESQGLRPDNTYHNSVSQPITRTPDSVFAESISRGVERSIPIMTTDDGIGSRTTIAEAVSTLSGLIQASSPLK